MPDPIYLDNNATTPMLPEVVRALTESFALPHLNPASQHGFGRQARRALHDAVDLFAQLLGVQLEARPADRLVLTSGGTEANNMALFGLIGGRDAPPGHLIISEIEHASISEVAEYLALRGWQVDKLAVDARGVVIVEALEDQIRADTRLVSVMLGNNETGVLQPVAELAGICRAHGVLFHTDACQVVGKLPVDFGELGVDALSLAAHKFHGPLGIGALVVRAGVELVADMSGGHQQQGLRPGTEPVALAVGMTRALECWHAEREARVARLCSLRDRFESAILDGWPNAVVVGRDSPRLPHTSNLALVGLDRQALLMALDQAGVACSTGSACASGSSQPSPMLVAMGCPPEVVASALRFSLGAQTTSPDVDEAVRRILLVANDLRRLKRA